MEFIERVRAGLRPRYEVADEVGRGGSAVVLRAVRSADGRQVAVKVLNPDVWSGVSPERFAREIRIAGGLGHPNILPLLDSGDVDGLLYYVMPFAEGETLRGRLDREGALPIGDALALIRSVAAALGHAHDQGVVHRDVKPENILLTPDGVRIADFGVAQAVDHAAESFRTTTGHTPGTPAYMSPEQIGSEATDPRTDIYALGCVLYEVLTGEPPFTGRTAQAIVARHLSERPPSVEVVRPTVPAVVADAIERCLAKVPTDRFRSMAELIHWLEGAEDAPLRAGARPTMLSRAWLPALGVAAAAVAAFVLWPPGEGEAGGLDDQTVVVFPLAVVGDEDGPDVGWEVALAIGTALEHTDPLRWVDGWRFLDPETRADAARITPAISRAIAEERGAGRYLWGVVRRTSDSVAVTLRLIDPRTGEDLASETAWGAAGAPIHQVGLAAVLPLLPTLLEPGGRIDLSPLLRRSPGAVALTLQGDRAYRRARFDEAYDFYRRAIDEDSLLVIAAARGAAAGIWEEGYDEAGALARLGVRHDSLLPERHRHFVRGVEAYIDGRADSALAALDRALAGDPGWVEAGTLVGEVAYHLFPRDPIEAGPAFERVTALDAGFTPPLIHLIEMDLRSGENDRASTRLTRLSEAVGTDDLRVLRLEWMRDCVASEEAWDAARWVEIAGEFPAAVLAAGHALAVQGRQPECAEGAFRGLASVGGGWEWISLLGLQSILLAQGRIDEVGGMLDEALATGVGGAQNLLLFDAPLSDRFHGGAAEVVAEARRRLGDQYERAANPRNLWQLSIWHALNDDVEGVRAVAARLAALRDSSAGRQFDLLAAAVEAHLALVDTRSVAPLSALEPTAPLWALYWELHEPLALEKILLARALLEAGQHERALREASRFDHPSPVTYVAYLGPSLMIRARAAEALGDRAAARDFRTRLARLGWSDGDLRLASSGPLISSTPPNQEPS